MPPNYVGYLVNKGDGVHGEPGLIYDYILAKNGILVRADSPNLFARVLIAEAEVRGLQPMNPLFILRGGPVPRGLFVQALAEMTKNPLVETYVAIQYYDGAYHVAVPDQQGEHGSLVYAPLPNVVVELHSHPDFAAFHSSTDNQDEQGFKIYGSVGNIMEALPQLALRVGVYGYYQELGWADVFTGPQEVDMVGKEMEETVVPLYIKPRSLWDWLRRRRP